MRSRGTQACTIAEIAKPSTSAHEPGRKDLMAGVGRLMRGGCGAPGPPAPTTDRPRWLPCAGLCALSGDSQGPVGPLSAARPIVRAVTDSPLTKEAPMDKIKNAALAAAGVGALALGGSAIAGAASSNNSTATTPAAASAPAAPPQGYGGGGPPGPHGGGKGQAERPPAGRGAAEGRGAAQ